MWNAVRVAACSLAAGWAAAQVQFTSASHHEPLCVDGVCVPNRVTNGYYPTRWRPWPLNAAPKKDNGLEEPIRLPTNEPPKATAEVEMPAQPRAPGPAAPPPTDGAPPTDGSAPPSTTPPGDELLPPELRGAIPEQEPSPYANSPRRTPARPASGLSASRLGPSLARDPRGQSAEEIPADAAPRSLGRPAGFRFKDAEPPPTMDLPPAARNTSTPEVSVSTRSNRSPAGGASQPAPRAGSIRKRPASDAFGAVRPSRFESDSIRPRPESLAAAAFDLHPDETADFNTAAVINASSETTSSDNPPPQTTGSFRPRERQPLDSPWKAARSFAAPAAVTDLPEPRSAESRPGLALQSEDQQPFAVDLRDSTDRPFQDPSRAGIPSNRLAADPDRQASKSAPDISLSPNPVRDSASIDLEPPADREPIASPARRPAAANVAMRISPSGWQQSAPSTANPLRDKARILVHESAAPATEFTVRRTSAHEESRPGGNPLRNR